MFNYTVNWLKIIKENLPSFLHTDRRLKFIESLMKPLKDLHAGFLLMVDEYSQRARFTSEKQYIQKALNLKYDPIGNGITIENNLPKRVIVYQDDELQVNPWVFQEWNDTTSYLIGEFAQYDLGVYKAKTNNLNKKPSTNPGDWDVELYAVSVTIVRQDSEYDLVNYFTVKVPVAIPYVEEEMRAIIDLYSLAGIDYNIITY